MIGWQRALYSEATMFCQSKESAARVITEIGVV